ncbi:DUF342 domain-containing protein [Iocasia frigidifontis]|uniref:DUF342 domain-containing protein n=1 Tax=Iocasia fonsfrigidae TaxID=2682810 RepID=A0A8A7K732_9FIRM|nr:FapA family protein [Iocasia fonsfrigidae]QTL96980.1 DUF342 domain-containing protein [Iocasia fonsfrigidae]
MSEMVRVTASNQKKALELAREELAAKLETELEVNIEQLEVRQVGKKGGFLGFGAKKVYQITFNEEGLSQREEEILDMTTEGLQMDGAFEIRVADEGVLLKVIPAEGEGDPVKYQAVKVALEKKEIVQIDWQLVQEAVHEADDEWIKIAPRLPELDKDAELKIEISDDKLRAFISYFPPLGGKELSTDDIVRILNEENISFGIKEEKITSLVKRDKEVENLLIAEGRPPVEGSDAKFIYHFEKNKESIGTKREDGSIDYYDLGIITNVNPGDVLVTKEAPQPGKPGKTITGEEIQPPEPKDKELPGGKNVERKDDNTLVASIAGQVVVDGNKINVLPIYEVNGDVDLSTGNIDFVGNVVVKGNVMEGFKVKASGNVEVNGHVFAAHIDAGGSVIIKKGFVGKNKYHIHAQGDVQAKFIENGIIKTEQSLIVTDAIMHSQISVGKSVEVTQNKGLLVGGLTRASNLIEANIIGSHLATATQLEVGIDPELKNKIKELEEDISETKVNLDKSLKALDILEKLKKQTGSLPQAKQLMYVRLQSTTNKLQDAIDEKKAQVKQLNEKFDNVDGGRIIVNRKIYPGVSISIGKSQLNVYNPMNATSFIEREGDITQVPV